MNLKKKYQIFPKGLFWSKHPTIFHLFTEKLNFLSRLWVTREEEQLNWLIKIFNQNQHKWNGGTP